MSGSVGRLDLEVVGREADGDHWLVTDAVVMLSSKRASPPDETRLRITLEDREVAQFTSELRDFINRRRDHAALQHIEDEIGVRVTRVQPVVTLHGYLATSGVAGCLHFAMLAKEDRLATTLRELETIVERFPPS